MAFWPFAKSIGIKLQITAIEVIPSVYAFSRFFLNRSLLPFLFPSKELFSMKLQQFVFPAESDNLPVDEPQFLSAAAAGQIAHVLVSVGLDHSGIVVTIRFN